VTGGARAGFTLIEVLVALAVAVLVGGLVLQVFSQGLRNADVADRMVRANAVAESLLARVGRDLPLEPGETSGTEGTFSWTVTIAPLDEAAQPGPPAELRSVTATVRFGARPNERGVTLTTLELAVIE
jgi:prepilin-type N-terminal cleavage/methylation domain-containing protein